MAVATLRYRVGDMMDALFSGDVDIACHGCNCFCAMGKGLAQQVKAQLPSAFEADQETKKGDVSKLGKYSCVELANGGIFLNCYTQFHWQRRLNGEGLNEQDEPVLCDYRAVRQVMGAIAREWPGRHVGLPLIGAGLARGDWSVVERIIEVELVAGGSPVTIYVLAPEMIPSWRRS